MRCFPRLVTNTTEEFYPKICFYGCLLLNLQDRDINRDITKIKWVKK